jgi:hypothetical protein
LKYLILTVVCAALPSLGFGATPPQGPPVDPGIDARVASIEADVKALRADVAVLKEAVLNPPKAMPQTASPKALFALDGVGASSNKQLVRECYTDAAGYQRCRWVERDAPATTADCPGGCAPLGTGANCGEYACAVNGGAGNCSCSPAASAPVRYVTYSAPQAFAGNGRTTWRENRQARRANRSGGGCAACQ